MSLVTTKSTEGNPASYVNRFKNTFEIHANAEIAVQEVVLNRAHKFVTGPNAKMYVRHGDSTSARRRPARAAAAGRGRAGSGRQA